MQVIFPATYACNRWIDAVPAHHGVADRKQQGREKAVDLIAGKALG
jgi:hypothetical protein